MRSPSVVVSTLAAVLAMEVSAAEIADGRLRIDGYGGWAYGLTSAYHYLSGSPAGDYSHTNFGLNIGARVSDHLSILSQVELLSDDVQKVSTELDYVFAEWQVADWLRIRAGAVKQPFGISAEVFDVGTLRPFLDLPQAFYGPLGFTGEAYRGIGVAGIFSSGDWRLTYDAYAGGLVLVDNEHPILYLEGLPLPEEEHVDIASNVLGGRFVAVTPVDGLSVGVSGYVAFERWGIHRYTVAAQAEYLTDAWSIRTEGAYHEDHDPIGAHDHAEFGGYFEAAYWLTEHWQLAAAIGVVRTSATGVASPSVPSLLSHTEGQVGLGYWLSPDLAFKAAYHRVIGNRIVLPEPGDLANTIAAGRLATAFNLFQAGVQFSF